MAAPLNIRDIGPDRKAAIEAEAAAAGMTISDIVRDWIDAGITRARAEREHATNGGTLPPERAGVRLFRFGRLLRHAHEEGDVAVACELC